MALRAVILAAGAGTRMKSDRPKVLHEIAGKPMVGWVIDAVQALAPDQVVVVVGHGADEVTAALPEGVEAVLQPEQLGTGHATQVALEAMGDVSRDAILVLPGDTPLLRPETLKELVDLHMRTGSAVSLLTAEVDDPTGYGRILRDGWDRVVGVVEHKDATTAQRAITEVNGGVYVFAGELLADALGLLDRDNAQGEYYLPDVLAILAEKGHGLAALKTTTQEILGVNSHDQLAEAAAVMRHRINVAFMREGVWMEDPATTYIDHDVTIQTGARLHAGVHLERGTVVEADAEVGPDVYAVASRIGSGARVWYAVLREAVVGPRAQVGPYASLRPGTVLEGDAKAGTFVEMKNTVVHERAKVPHLSYLGDAEVGADANVGAGTITCNYDGVEKHRTVIGERAFIGSDTMLVAPVTIGDDATTGAGSVITRDVSPGALAVERAQQREIPDYAARRAARKAKLADEKATLDEKD